MLIASGEAKLYQNNILLSYPGHLAFLGEELLFSTTSQYEYNIIANSAMCLLVIDADVFKDRMSGDYLYKMHRVYLSKHSMRRTTLNNHQQKILKPLAKSQKRAQLTERIESRSTLKGSIMNDEYQLAAEENARMQQINKGKKHQLHAKNR